MLRFTLGDELPELLDDLPGARRLNGCLLHQVSGPIPARFVISFQHAAAGFEVIDDGGERLVELMGKSRCHLAHLGQA